MPISGLRAVYSIIITHYRFTNIREFIKIRYLQLCGIYYPYVIFKL